MQQSFGQMTIKKINKKKLDVDELQQKGSVLSQFYDPEQAKKLISDFNKKVDKIKKQRDQEEYQKRFQKYKDKQEEEQKEIEEEENLEDGKRFIYIQKNRYNYKFLQYLDYNNDNNSRIIESKEYKCNVCKRKIYYDPRFIHHRTGKQVALESPYKAFYSKPRVHYCEPQYRILYDPVMSNVSPREDVIGHMLEFQDFEHCRICRQPQNILWLHMFMQNNPSYRKW